MIFRVIKFSTNDLDEVIPRMEAVFNKIVEDGPEAFDVERIQDYIDRLIQQNKNTFFLRKYFYFCYFF